MNAKPLNEHQAELISLLGICDRLRALTFMVAICMNARQNRLFLDLTTSKHCPYNLDELFRIEGMEFKITKNLFPVDFFLTTEHFDPPRIDRTGSLYFGGVDAGAFYRTWSSAYGALRPHEPVQSKIDALNVNESFLGVHVRRTDKVGTSLTGEWGVSILIDDLPILENKLLSDIFSKLKETCTNNVYLACDNQNSMKFYSEYLTARGVVVVTSEEPYDASKFRQTTGDSLVMDIFNLSKCSEILHSVKSGVPYTAKMIKEYSWTN